MIARFWPVDAVVGENGAFYFWHDPKAGKLRQRFLQSEAEREAGRQKLEALKAKILREVPQGVQSEVIYVYDLQLPEGFQPVNQDGEVSEFKLLPEIMDQARENARKYHVGFDVTDNMDEAFKDADVVYPKSWGPLLTTTTKEEGKATIEKYRSWITDSRRMDLTQPDSIYMHCLPADRNLEVSDEVIDGAHSVVYDEAENRLHAQKAVMALTMS